MEPQTLKQTGHKFFEPSNMRKNTSKLRKVTSKQRKTTSNSFTTAKPKRHKLQASANPSPIQAYAKTGKRKIEEKASKTNSKFFKKKADFKKPKAKPDLRSQPCSITRVQSYFSNVLFSTQNHC